MALSAPTAEGGAASDDGLDLLWGAGQIGDFIRRPTRATYHMLERGQLPAKKVGKIWTARRSALAAHFTNDTGDVESALAEAEPKPAGTGASGPLAAARRIKPRAPA